MKFISEMGSEPGDDHEMKKHVFGHNYRTDARGNPIEQGIGSDHFWRTAPHNSYIAALTGHLAAIEKLADGKEAAAAERARIAALRRAGGHTE